MRRNFHSLVYHNTLTAHLRAHSHSFHISVWFVSLTGIKNEQFVKEVKFNYDEVILISNTLSLLLIMESSTVKLLHCDIS